MEFTECRLSWLPAPRPGLGTWKAAGVVGDVEPGERASLCLRSLAVCVHAATAHGFPYRCDDRSVDVPEILRDWIDSDVAQFTVGKALGLFPGATAMADVKSVFWSDNPLGNALYATLANLAAAGVIEHRQEPDDQFRWVVP